MPQCGIFKGGGGQRLLKKKEKKRKKTINRNTHGLQHSILCYMKKATTITLSENDSDMLNEVSDLAGKNCFGNTSMNHGIETLINVYRRHPEEIMLFIKELKK